MANSLWGPLLQASFFPERNFLEELTRPPPPQRSPSSLDRDYHRRRRAAAAGGDHVHEEGSLWRYYAELSNKKKLRELGIEQARAFALDGLFPSFPRFVAPYGDFAGSGNDFAPPPAGPWHAPGPAFPEYDWGPGIGGGAGFPPPPPPPPGPPPASVMVDGPGGRWLQYAGPSVVGGPHVVGGGGGFVPDDPGGDWTASDHQRWW